MTSASVAARAPRLGALPWRSILRRELPQIARIVIVAAVAWQICLSLGANQPPVFAAIVPLVTLRDDPFSAFNLSIARLVGVVAGIVIAIGVLKLWRLDTVAIAAVLALALAVGMVVRVGNVLNIQVAVSALLVFSSADAADYAVTRLWETGVGTVSLLLLAPFLFPANPLSAARAELARVAAELTDALRSATELVGEGHADHAERAAVLRTVVDQLAELGAGLQVLGSQMRTARKSARWTLVRRSEMRAVADLEPTRRLAVRLGRHLEAFADEAITLGDRPDFRRDATLRTDRLQRLVDPLASCVGAALTGRPFAEDLGRARAAVDEVRAADRTPLGAILRRPLHGMVEDLQAFAARG